MPTTRGTTIENVEELFDPDDPNTARQAAAVEVALELAEGFVDDRLADVPEYQGETDRLARFERLVAAHALHSPYPHEDEANVGDSSASFAGADLGASMDALDPDGLAETRFGRLVLTYDTEDALKEKNDVFRSFGPSNPADDGRTSFRGG